jgi:hypothetical protein
VFESADAMLTEQAFVACLEATVREKRAKLRGSGDEWVKVLLHALDTNLWRKQGAHEQREAEIEKEEMRLMKAATGTICYGTDISTDIQIGQNAFYTVVGTPAAGVVKLRAGPAMDSAAGGDVPKGAKVRVEKLHQLPAEDGEPGRLRAYIVEPREGWASVKLLQCASDKCGWCFKCETGLRPSEAAKLHNDRQARLHFHMTAVNEKVALLDETEIQLREVQREVTDAKAKQDQLVQLNTELDRVRQELEDRIAERDATCAELKEELLETKAQSTEAEVERLKQELESEKAAHEQARLELESEKASREHASATETALEMAVERLRSELAEAKKYTGYTSELELKTQQLEEELSGAVIAQLALERELENAMEVENVCHAKIRRLETQLGTRDPDPCSPQKELQATLALLALRDREMTELEEILQAEESIGRALEEELAQERASARENLPKVLSQLEAAHRRLNNMDDLHTQEVQALRTQLGYKAAPQRGLLRAPLATFDEAMRRTQARVDTYS